MSLMSIAEEHLTRLSQKLGIERGELSHDGEAVVRCELSGIVLDILILVREDEELIALWAPVARLPRDEGRSDVLLALMGANLFGAGANGLTFAMAPEEGVIYVGHCLLHPGITFNGFESAFARVAAVGAHWKREFQKQPSTRLE